MSDPTWTPAMLAANFESMRLLYLQAEAERATANQENAALTREVAGLRYYIAQLERNVSQEERAYAAGIASLMLTQYDIDNPSWNPAADLQTRDGQRINDPREQPRA